ncbi:MAG: cupin domain-containing protein [Pseudomonadota bacterium]
MNAKGIIRLDPNGPEGVGLAPMEIDPGDFQQAPEEQRIHVYFEDPALNLAVGVWTTTDMQEPFGPYPGDEFMVVLEGRVEMLDGDGGVTPVEIGEGFATRDGAPLSWRQTGFLKKAFILMSDGETPEAVPGQGVFVAKPAPGAHQMQDAEEMIGGGRQREVAVYQNDAGNMEAGIWETTAFETEMAPFSVHEFAHIISGAVTITDEQGAAHDFAAGDSLFIAAGTICKWSASGDVRKYYAAVTPV